MSFGTAGSMPPEELTKLLQASQEKLFALVGSQRRPREILELARLEIEALISLTQQNPSQDRSISVVIDMWREVDELRMLPLDNVN